MKPQEAESALFSRRVTIDLSPGAYEKLKSLSNDRQTTQSDIIRRAVYLMYSLNEVIDVENRVSVLNKEGEKLNFIF